MSSSWTVLNTGVGGDNVDMESITYGGAPTTRKRTRTVISGTTEAGIADVVNSEPSGSAYGVTTRSIVSGAVAHGAADAGAPVKVGGRVVEDIVAGEEDVADRCNLQFDRRGVVYTQVRGPRTPGGVFLVAADSTGPMAAGLAQDSQIFQLRWDSGSGWAKGLIRRVLLTHFATVSTAFAAGLFRFTLHTVREWTANGTGGTSLNTAFIGSLEVQQDVAIPIGGGANSDIRIATTAALGEGSQNAKSLGVGMVAGVVPNSVGSHLPAHGGELYNWRHSGEPIVLDDNNGVAVKATVPQTGTWIFGIQVEFAAATTYRIY
jgi:hypothetical protein